MIDDMILSAYREGRNRHFREVHRPGCERGCATRAGLADVESLLAARVLRNVSDQISNRVRELRDNYRTGAASIEYINGMEDADLIVERAIAHHELSAEEVTQ